MKNTPLITQISMIRTSTHDLGHWTNTEEDNLKHFPKETLRTCQLDNTLHILQKTHLSLLAIQKVSLALRAHPRLTLSYLRVWLEPYIPVDDLSAGNYVRTVNVSIATNCMMNGHSIPSIIFRLKELYYDAINPILILNRDIIVSDIMTVDEERRHGSWRVGIVWLT